MNRDALKVLAEIHQEASTAISFIEDAHALIQADGRFDITQLSCALKSAMNVKDKALDTILSDLIYEEG